MFFILERVCFTDSRNIDRPGGQSQQAQVIFLDRLIGIRLRVCSIQPLQFLYIGIMRLR